MINAGWNSNKCCPRYLQVGQGCQNQLAFRKQSREMPCDSLPWVFLVPFTREKMRAVSSVNEFLSCFVMCYLEIKCPQRFQYRHVCVCSCMCMHTCGGIGKGQRVVHRETSIYNAVNIVSLLVNMWNLTNLVEIGGPPRGDLS